MNDVNIHNSKVGAIGDYATIYGGINFYGFTRPQPMDATTLPAAISLGGIGKAQLTSEFVHRL